MDIWYTSLVINFDLPKELIAQEPARPRDHARLLIYDRKSQTITDDFFYNVAKYLPASTTLVVNNSKVEHCRLLFPMLNNNSEIYTLRARKLEKYVEIFILDSVNDRTVRALVRPGKVFKLGKIVQLSDDVQAEVTSIDDDGIRTLVFSEDIDHPDLVAARHVPLPPYIKQNDDLATEYQTIYAKTLGSKAAPTAGLHFTKALEDKIKSRYGWAEITLHVGLGTFASLTDEHLASGRLHEEWYEVDEATADEITKTEHITAVGTTSVRTLESIYGRGGGLKGSTDILIQPGYDFKRVDSLITNFHLPGTSLLLLVEAFVGSEMALKKIYEHAIAEKYRFYSFGDAMLIV